MQHTHKWMLLIWSFSVLLFDFRPRGWGLPHPLPPRLQAQRLVGLVGLQRLLWQRVADALQVAERESLQQGTSLSKAGLEKPGKPCSSASTSGTVRPRSCEHSWPVHPSTFFLSDTFICFQGNKKFGVIYTHIHRITACQWTLMLYMQKCPLFQNDITFCCYCPSCLHIWALIFCSHFCDGRPFAFYGVSRQTASLALQDLGLFII